MHLESIGFYETKTHLADLLRRVRQGQGFTITQRGEPWLTCFLRAPACAGLARRRPRACKF